MMSFEQATIKLEKEKEFAELKGAIERVFRPGQVEKFLKQVEKQNIRLREWDKVTALGLLEKADDAFSKLGTTARKLYESLSLSDQAQMREFYLSKLETVDVALRHRFKKLYQYY
jgi:hypothetical protein